MKKDLMHLFSRLALPDRSFSRKPFYLDKPEIAIIPIQELNKEYVFEIFLSKIKGCTPQSFFLKWHKINHFFLDSC